MSEVYTGEDLNSLFDRGMGPIQPWIATQLYKKNMPKKYLTNFLSMPQTIRILKSHY